MKKRQIEANQKPYLRKDFVVSGGGIHQLQNFAFSCLFLHFSSEKIYLVNLFLSMPKGHVGSKACKKIVSTFSPSVSRVCVVSNFWLKQTKIHSNIALQGVRLIQILQNLKFFWIFFKISCVCKENKPWGAWVLPLILLLFPTI